MATSNSKNQVSRVQAGDNKANATEVGVLAGSNGTGNALSDDSTSTGVLSVSAIRTGAVSATGVAGTIGVALQGLYGRLTINQDGTYVYVVDNSNATVNALAKGESLQESFTYTASNGTASAQAAIVVKVNGANDAATITGLASGAVLEDGATAVASGKLTVTDVDRGESLVKTDNEQSGEYGKFSITADGAWTYVLTKNSSDVQSLSAGETVSDKFVVTSKDGSASQNVSVTVTGTNDVARIEGDARGALTEDAKKTVAHGELNIKDTDHGESAARVVTDQAGTYGSFSVDAKGRWTYVLNNSLLAVQALAQDEKGTDSFVVWSKDGSVSQTVTMTINGVNDAATITGADTGSVNEDASPNTATGKLTVNDVDHGEDTVVPVVNRIGSFGSFSIAADGTWTYTLNNSLATVQALGAGVVRTETFTVYSKDSQLADLSGDDNDDDNDNEDDGSDDDHDDDSGEGDHDDDGSDDDHQTSSYHGASKVITVTIIGTNDAAVITGSSTGAVTEDLSLATSGQLSATDVDTGEIGLQVQSAIAGAYGSFSVDAGGYWTFGLNNAAANVQALAANEAATDTFAVKSFDGTEKLVTVTVTGTNDAASISGASAGATTEDTAITTSGTLTVADVDHDEAMVQAQANVAGAYGSFNIAADGNWTYALNNAAANVQALGSGEQTSDSFTVVSKDGSASQTVTVNIGGTNDAPVITNTATALVGSVKEDTTLSASGQLSASDVDNGATQTWSVQGAATGVYGVIAVDANGKWTYALDNAAHQNLAVGESHAETFTVRVTDDQGAAVDQSVTMTVTGTNDMAAITGSSAGAVTEDGTLTTRGTLAVADVDSGEAVFRPQTNVLGSFGSFSIGTDGNWAYALNNGAANVQALAEGQQAHDSFTVLSKDGTASQIVTVAITGSNDASVLKGTFTEPLYAASHPAWGSLMNSAGVWVAPNGGAIGDLIPHSFIRQFTAVQAGTYTLNFSADNIGSISVNGVAIAGLQNYTSFSSQANGSIALAAGVHTIVLDVQNSGGPAGFALAIKDPAGTLIWDTRSHVAPEALVLDYTENQAATAISAGLSLADIDSTHLVAATVSVGTGFAAGQDVLGFANQNGISGAYNSATGVLSLSGSATLAQYQTALRSVTYSNSSDNPSTAVRSVNFAVDDGASQLNLSNTVTTAVNVRSVNDAPVAHADTGATNEDTALTLSAVSLLSNDTDPDGAGPALISAVSVTSARGASVTLNAHGDVVYDPTGSASLQALTRGQQSTDSFGYTAADASGATSTTTVVITVEGRLEAPVANPDAVTVLENGSTHGNVVTNDSVNGSTAGSGNVLINGSFEQGNPVPAGGIQYPASLPGWTSAQGSFEVWGTGFLGNIASDGIAFLELDNGGGRDAYSSTLLTTAGRSYTLNFDLALRNGTAPASNQVEFFVNGVSLGIFTPPATTFSTFTVNFIGSGNDVIMFKEPASANDGLGGLIDNLRIAAHADVFVTAVDGNTGAVGSAVTGSHGGAFVIASNGDYSFDPGTAFDYLATGETATSSVSYTVTDDGGSATSTVTVTVTGSNDAPIGTATTALTAGTEDTAYGINASSLLAGFSDVDAGDTLSVSGLAASNGTVTANANGTFTITPTANFNGAVTLNYNVVDSQGASVAATQSYTLAAANDAPVAVGDTNGSDTVIESNALNNYAGDPTAVGNVLANDTDVDIGDAKTVSAVNGVALSVGASIVGTYGAVTIASDGSYTYTLDNNNSATNALPQGAKVNDVFNYTATDAAGATSSTTLSIGITGTNDRPVAGYDQNYNDPVQEAGIGAGGVVVTGDATAVSNVLANDSDVDAGSVITLAQFLGSAANIGVPIQGTYGSIVLSSNGDYTYTLDNTRAATNALAQGATAVDAFDMVLIADQFGLTFPSRLHMVVLGANDAPTGTATTVLAAGTEDTAYTLSAASLLAGFSDVDTGDTLSVSGLTASNGTVTATANGAFTITPTANFNGAVALSYNVVDGHGGSVAATQSYTLAAVNDVATITGTSTGTVKEDTTPSASGRLVVTDPDSGQSLATAQTTTGTYGTFTVDVNGNWAYNLNNSLSAVQALAQGSTVNQTFTVASQDNSANKSVTVAVNGTNDAPVAANDAISGGVLTFEDGTYTQSGNTITTGDFKFDGSYVTGYWGADSTNTIYSSGWYSTSPITMTRTDGQSFKLESANVTGYSYGYGQATETVTGYLHGVQVASQAFAVPESAYGAHNNTVGLTDPGFSAVDRVVFGLSGPYYEYQWLDNITIPNTVAQARDVSVLLNDIDVDAGAHLSVASFSGFSAHGAAISLNANGTLHYDPTVSAELQAVHQGVNVYDTFTYQSQDEFGALSNLATVGVTVVGVHA